MGKTSKQTTGSACFVYFGGMKSPVKYVMHHFVSEEKYIFLSQVILLGLLIDC